MLKIYDKVKKYGKMIISSMLIPTVVIFNLYFSLSASAIETISVKMFAVPADLMNLNNFSLADGDASKAGRISFGTRPETKYIGFGSVLSEPSTQTTHAGSISWLVAGKDSKDTTLGAPANNIILFSEVPIIGANSFDSVSSSFFQTSTDNQTYNYEPNSGYGDTAGSIEVFSNHYGASNVRKQLQNLVGTNSTYFSTGERSLMKKTTITTYDAKNSKDYTTEDILYVPLYDSDKMISAQDTTSPILDVGSASDVVVNLLNFGKGGFWARSLPNIAYFNSKPPENFKSLMLPVLAGGSFPLEAGGVDDGSIAVSAAFKLDLSSVLFASAVPVVSSVENSESFSQVSDDNAMNLRLDAKLPNSPFKEDGIGTAFKSSDNSDTIEVSKAAGSTLLVQGVYNNNGDKINWSYSKKIDSDDKISVTANDVSTANDSEIPNFSIADFSDCKVWLEQTSTQTDTAGLTYAVMSTSDLDEPAPAPADTSTVAQIKTGDAAGCMLIIGSSAMLMVSGGLAVTRFKKKK